MRCTIIRKFFRNLLWMLLGSCAHVKILTLMCKWTTVRANTAAAAQHIRNRLGPGLVEPPGESWPMHRVSQIGVGNLIFGCAPCCCADQPCARPCTSESLVQHLDLKITEQHLCDALSPLAFHFPCRSCFFESIHIGASDEVDNWCSGMSFQSSRA